MRTRLDGPPGKDMTVKTYTGGRKMAAVLFASLVFGALLICSLMVTRASVASSTLPSGPVPAWWDYADFMSRMPAGLDNAKDISQTPYFSVALKADGTVVSWENWESSPVPPVPAELKDPLTSHVVAIDSRNGHTLALKADGTVVGWGEDLWGPAPQVPDELKDPLTSHVKAISAGQLHDLALKEDGTVVAWGESSFGRTNVPDALKDPLTSHVKAIDAGEYHNLALKEDGTVVAWGSNYSGETEVPQDLGKVKAIAAVSDVSFAVKEDGTVAAWGKDAEYVPAELKDPQTSHVRAIDGEWANAPDPLMFALREDGTVLSWLHGNTPYDPNVMGLNEVEDIDAGGDGGLLLNRPTPPGPVDYFEAGAGNAEVSLSWSNPTDADFEGVRVLRSTTGPATSPVPSADQELVYEGKGESYTDTALTNGTTYYYTAYTTDDAGLFSQRVTKRVMPVAPPAPPDTASPTVLSTTPTDGASGVLRNSSVVANFSEPMKASSLTSDTFKLYRCSNAKIGSCTTLLTNAPVTLSESGTSATLDPYGSTSTLLASKGKYKAVLTSGAQDAAGNALDQDTGVAGYQDKVWYFTTGRR